MVPRQWCLVYELRNAKIQIYQIFLLKLHGNRCRKSNSLFRSTLRKEKVLALSFETLTACEFDSHCGTVSSTNLDIQKSRELALVDFR